MKYTPFLKFLIYIKIKKNVMINAINKRHQSKVNRAVKTLVKYNALNDLRNIADDNGEEKLYKKLDRQCLNTFDKYLDIVNELPTREKIQIEKEIY